MIVDKWLVYSTTVTRVQWEAAVADAASIPPDESLALVAEDIERLMPGASSEEQALATGYVASIPGAIRRSLLSDAATGELSVPRSISSGDSMSLLQLLPIDAPPYLAPCQLEDTQFKLEELVGVGGFGAVYKASSEYEQNLPKAIKVCLDTSMRTLFAHELELLERLMSDWTSLPEKIVRLYGYSIDTERPFLVYEYVPGGDLYNLLLGFVGEEGQGLPPELALELMRDIVEPLAYTHERGLVHRDLKPANILVNSNSRDLSEIVGRNAIKLTDFGIGGVAAVNSIKQMGLTGYLGGGQLSSLEQVSMLRGSGTALYMSPEQRRGDPPDPRHDIYSLGVIWYQLLFGQLSVEMDLGWEGRLELRNAPWSHIDVIKKCVDRLEVRPVNASELLEMLPAGSSSTPANPKILARKFCIMCGVELTPNIRFCRSCGHRL